MTRQTWSGIASNLPLGRRVGCRKGATAAAVLLGVGLLAWVGTTSRASAADAGAGGEYWPQWRGPALTGEAAPSADPPVEWGEGKNVRWKVKLPGAGSSTPVIWGEKIFIQTA